MDINASRVRSGGESVEKLLAVAEFRVHPAFSEAERAALAYAEAVTTTPTAVTDAVFEPLRRHFTNPQIVELAATIAIEHFRAKFHTAPPAPAPAPCLLPPRGQALQS